MSEPEGIERDFPLARLTTVRAGGAARCSPARATEERLVELLAFAAESGAAVGVVGSGSNLLVADDGFRGLVLKLDGELATIERDGDRVLCGGGARLPSAAAKSAGWGLSGLEFGVNIPGTVGGAVRMNANAYGGELAADARMGRRLHGRGAASGARPSSSASPTGARTSARAEVVSARLASRSRRPTPSEVKATLAGMRGSAARRSPRGSRPSARPSRTPTTRAPRAARPGSCSKRPAAAASRSAAPASPTSTRTSSRTPARRPPPTSSR